MQVRLAQPLHLPCLLSHMAMLLVPHSFSTTPAVPASAGNDQPIPNCPVRFSVLNYGAKADGKTGEVFGTRVCLVLHACPLGHLKTHINTS